MDYGLDLDYNPFPTTELVNIGGNNYYKKPSSGAYSAQSWNYLYGSTGVLLRLNLQAYSQDGNDYFPLLGDDVPPQECYSACQIAQQKLNNIGLTHIDLFDGKGNYNCTNVRKVNGDYYPIDMMKIIQVQHGGRRKNKKAKSRKHNKSKSRKHNKSKSRKHKQFI